MITLQEIIVSDSRLPVDSELASGRVTSIPSSEFSQSSSLLSDLLNRQVGISIRAYGPAGLASASMRGGTSSRIAILYDGVELVNPQLGEFDLSLFDLQGAEAVQIVHGSASAYLGGSAASGAINIIPQSQGKTSAYTGYSMGSFNTRIFRLGGLAESNYGQIRVTGSRYSTAGDFPFRDDTIFPVATVRRNDASRTSNEISVHVSPAVTSSTLGIRLNRSQRGLPGSVGSASSGEEQLDRQFHAWISHLQRLGSATLVSNGSYQRYGIRYMNPGLGLDDNGISRALTLDQEVSIRRNTVSLRAGHSLRSLRADHPSLISTDVELSAAVFGDASMTMGRTTVNAVMRTDYYSLSDDDTWVIINPRVGTNILLNRAAKVRLKASAGRSANVPTFNDRFWLGVGTVGNPALRPEEGWTFDMGLLRSKERFRSEISLFRSNVRNQIEWRPNSNGIWSPANIGRVRSVGLEASVQTDTNLGPLPVAMRANYSFVEAVDKTNPGTATFNNQLRYVPRHDGALTLFISRNTARVSIAGNIQSKRYVTADQNIELPAYGTVDVEAQNVFKFGSNTLLLSAAVKNVLNSRYTLIQGYPMPLRNYSIGLRYTLQRQ
ncbi:MAG: TonB-dependent receptor [Rhodothermales bacterium]|nr:TonB-dependent receptor [Rhodothermales bacterium]